MDAARFYKLACACACVRRVSRHGQADISEVEIVARMHLRARDSSSLVGAVFKVQIPGPIRVHNIRDLHQTASLERLGAIVPAILVDLRPSLSTFNMEVREQNVANAAPSRTARHVRRLIAATGLVDQHSNPCLDQSRAVQPLIADQPCAINDHVLGARVFEVLAQTANRNTVPTVARHIPDPNIVTPRLDSHTIISTLIHKVLEQDVIRIHGIKAIGILNPIRPVPRRRRRCRIDRDVSKRHVRPVHNVDGPQLGIADVEVGYGHVGHVPEDERHGPSGLGVADGRGGFRDVLGTCQRGSGG